MAVDDLTEEEDALVKQREMTIGELIDTFGREATRRGLEYMRSLSEADNRFRNVNEEVMEKGYERAGVQGDTTGASEEWAESVEENGLGLDNE